MEKDYYIYATVIKKQGFHQICVKKKKVKLSVYMTYVPKVVYLLLLLLI